MSNVSGVSGSSVSGYPGSDAPSGMSPDGLLAYCEMQLDGLGNQTNALITQQETQMNEQQQVDNVQTALEQFGTNGPQNAGDMQKCVAAFQTAIANLPPGDPVAAQLTAQMNTMESTYGYVAPGTLTTSQSEQLQQFDAHGGSNYLTQGLEKVATGTNAPELQGLQSAGQLNNAPANDEWQSTTDGVKNIASNISANANIQMLSLQNLASQMQQAVEQSTQMMSSENSTLLDEAKNVGQ